MQDDSTASLVDLQLAVDEFFFPEIDTFDDDTWAL